MRALRSVMWCETQDLARRRHPQQRKERHCERRRAIFATLAVRPPNVSMKRQLRRRQSLRTHLNGILAEAEAELRREPKVTDREVNVLLKQTEALFVYKELG